MTDTLYLAWCYLAHHRLKTIVLVGAVTVVLALPAGLRVLLDRSAEALTVRAEATPLLVGAKGSPLELVLDSLYFESDTPAPMNWAEVDRVTQSAGSPHRRHLARVLRFPRAGGRDRTRLRHPR